MRLGGAQELKWDLDFGGGKINAAQPEIARRPG